MRRWCKFRVHRRIGGLETPSVLSPCLPPVHRRIGGLEIKGDPIVLPNEVHRRIGGLEKTTGQSLSPSTVHRRIGGLERLALAVPQARHVHRRIGGLEKPKNLSSALIPVHRRIGGLETRARARVMAFQYLSSPSLNALGGAISLKAPEKAFTLPCAESDRCFFIDFFRLAIKQWEDDGLWLNRLKQSTSPPHHSIGYPSASNTGNDAPLCSSDCFTLSWHVLHSACQFVLSQNNF